MPLFKAYFLPEVSGNEPVEVDLALSGDAVPPLRDTLESARSEQLGVQVRLVSIIATEPFHIGPSLSGLIRSGDVVWRAWDGEDVRHLPDDELERQMRAYKPLWEPGPGWLQLRQRKWGDVQVRS